MASYVGPSQFYAVGQYRQLQHIQEGARSYNSIDYYSISLSALKVRHYDPLQCRKDLSIAPHVPC